MKTVAIFGVGLIGGSFALALRKAGFKGTILGVSSPHTITRALELGVVDRGLPASEAASQADLIYLALPISQILDSVAELQQWAAPEALITDAGSTKCAIVDHAARHISRSQFLGGHPMAGKEQRGVDAADPNLFSGRKYVFTPRHEEELRTPMAQVFQSWVVRIGSIPIVMSPEEHDRAVAFTSHLAQLASTGLSCAVQESGAPIEVSGPGLLDMTRLAMSPFDIWSDILATNAGPVREALDVYIQVLERLRGTLESNAMGEQFQEAAMLARELRGTKRLT